MDRELAKRSTAGAAASRRRFLIVGGHSAALAAFACRGLAAVEPNEPFRFTTPREGDEVRAAQENSATIFTVRSQRGIGEATIERRGERWPERIILRLHLRGLENFQIAAEKNAADAKKEGAKQADVKKIGVAVSSTGDGPPVRQWLDDREREPLDKRSPLWIDLRGIGSDGRPSDAIPLRDGYFELRLPAALTADNPGSLRLHWIDFFR